MGTRYPDLHRIDKDSARDVAASGRVTNREDTTLHALPTLQPVGETVDLDSVTRMRLELGTTPMEMAAEHLEDARPELVEALRMLDCTEHRSQYERVQRIVLEIDTLRGDLCALHSERPGS